MEPFLGNQLDLTTMDYLKDFGAASASNGAVGLYHIENLTPEAKEFGTSLLTHEYHTYEIDDSELERVYTSYPNVWQKKDAIPKKVFIGCPHLSRSQLEWWITAIDEKMQGKKVSIETILVTAPLLQEDFYKNKEFVKKLNRTGVKIASICPLYYIANPLSKNIPIITNSNKLRTYSTSRFYPDDILLEILQTGRIREGF